MVDGRLQATVTGFVEHVNKLISVRPLHSRYTGDIGDVVVGRIIDVGHGQFSIIFHRICIMSFVVKCDATHSCISCQSIMCVFVITIFLFICFSSVTNVGKLMLVVINMQYCYCLL